MKLAYTQSYDATPEQVVAMLKNPDFIAELARQAGAQQHDLEVSGDTFTVTLSVAAPPAARGFIGDTFTVKQLFRFSRPKPDGTIDGTLDLEIAGAPVDARADITVSPEGAAKSSASFDGDLDVRIPLLGGQIEQQAEPLIGKGIARIEETAKKWLAK